MAITNLKFEYPTGGSIIYSEFEVHKDPIRTFNSDGVQYRLKIKGLDTLPDAISVTGLIDTYNSEHTHFWLKKCFKCIITFSGNYQHILYLLPMSYQTFNDGSIQFICMEVSEKLIELNKTASVLSIGLDNFKSEFQTTIKR